MIDEGFNDGSDLEHLLVEGTDLINYERTLLNTREYNMPFYIHIINIFTLYKNKVSKKNI